MLSDRERETLADMERELLENDAESRYRSRDVVQAEPISGSRAHRVEVRYGWGLEWVIGLALLVSAFAILLVFIGQTAGVAMLAGLLAWLRFRFIAAVGLASAAMPLLLFLRGLLVLPHAQPAGYSADG